MGESEAMATRKGLPAQVFDYKMDCLLMALEQLDHKVARKAGEKINEQFSDFRGKLSRIDSELVRMNRSADRLEKSLDAFYSVQSVRFAAHKVIAPVRKGTPAPL